MRLLEDVRELKELVRELLIVEHGLTRTSESMDRKITTLDTANDRLEQALEELRGFNAKLDRLDRRVEEIEQEVRSIRGATDEIEELLPDVGKGPLAKARDALASE